MTKNKRRDTEVIRHDPRSRELARLQIRNGVNLRPGQRLHIKGMPVCCAGYARLLVEEAYEAGAADVTVSYDDAAISRLRYLHASDESLDDWYGYPAETVEKMIARGDCELVIFGSDPRAFEGCDPKRIRRANEARRKITEALDNAHVMMRIRRCTTAVPTPALGQRSVPGSIGREGSGGSVGFCVRCVSDHWRWKSGGSMVCVRRKGAEAVPHPYGCGAEGAALS